MMRPQCISVYARLVTLNVFEAACQECAVDRRKHKHGRLDTMHVHHASHDLAACSHADQNQTNYQRL